MKNEKKLIINELTRKNKNKKIRIIVEDEINYYSIYDLVSVFLQPADSKDYFKKSIKNDPIFKNIYKSLVQYKKYNKRERESSYERFEREYNEAEKIKRLGKKYLTKEEHFE